MKLKSEGLGDSLPKVEVNFDSVIGKLKTEGSAQGFRALRDFFLKNYRQLKVEFSPLGLMNLIIAIDKHAIFADMSSEKSKEHEQLRWRVFQDYLNGKVESFTMPSELEEELEDDELPVHRSKEGSED
jgi:hypothetical protein